MDAVAKMKRRCAELGLLLEWEVETKEYIVGKKYYKVYLKLKHSKGVDAEHFRLMSGYGISSVSKEEAMGKAAQKVLQDLEVRDKFITIIKNIFAWNLSPEKAIDELMKVHLKF